MVKGSVIHLFTDPKSSGEHHKKIWQPGILQQAFLVLFVLA